MITRGRILWVSLVADPLPGQEIHIAYTEGDDAQVKYLRVPGDQVAHVVVPPHLETRPIP